MGDIRFRVWFGDNAASADELERIERIRSAERRVAIGEARLDIGLCLNENRRRRHWPGDCAATFSRVRADTQFWHVADANTALDGRTLVEQPGDTLLLPAS